MALNQNNSTQKVTSYPPEVFIPPQTEAHQYKERIRPGANIVFLTGAGISQPSGLATFRSQNGLWNNHRVEDVADIKGFRRNPDLVRAFYNGLKADCQKAEPNPAHLAIAELQRSFPAIISVLTQNIDTLHEKAETRNVWHIHGRVDEAQCTGCGYVLKSWEDITAESICPICSKKAMLRPNIVFFGEPVKHTSVIHDLLSAADVFIAVGTSGTVPPAARFVNIAKTFGAYTLELNLEPVSNSREFDEHIFGDVAKTLPQLVKTLLKH